MPSTQIGTPSHRATLATLNTQNFAQQRGDCHEAVLLPPIIRAVAHSYDSYEDCGPLLDGLTWAIGTNTGLHLTYRKGRI